MSSRRTRITSPPLGVGLVALVALTGCVPTSTLDRRPCPCAEGWSCVDDACVRGEAPDAGATLDAGPDDAGPPDLDAGAGPGLDEPPPVPTDCWLRAEACDWSDPLGFELVAGDPSVIADLTISANPSFSPDGCQLFYDRAGVVHVARRASAATPFAEVGPLDGVDQSASRSSKASVTPDGLELFFTSNRTDGTYFTVHRAGRATPVEPWGEVTEVSALNFAGVNNWDGTLAPHGLRYYWTPARPGGQNLFVGERDRLDEPFGPGIVVEELSGLGNQAEPALRADGRVLTLVTSDAAFGGDLQLVYATRPHWRAPFGEVRLAPGTALEGVEADGTMSPDGCEVIVRRSSAVLYLVHADR